MFWLIGLSRHLSSELYKTGVYQKMKASGTHSISFMLFIFPSQQHCSTHTASSNAPASLLTHWPWLTQRGLQALWFIKKDASQASSRERSFLYLSPFPPRYITVLLGTCGSLWILSDKSFKKSLQFSLLHSWPKSGLD